MVKIGIIVTMMKQKTNFHHFHSIGWTLKLTQYDLRVLFIKDHHQSELSLQIDDVLTILNSIKNAGNYFFKLERYAEASHKYNKASRYHAYYSKGTQFSKEQKALLDSFYLTNCLNCAAVELKLLNYVDAKNACNLVSCVW